MSTIAEQYHQQAEVREFSIKEVCDIISTIVCCSTGDCPNDDETLEKAIKSAMCIEHSDTTINDIVEHILYTGAHKITELV